MPGAQNAKFSFPGLRVGRGRLPLSVAKSPLVSSNQCGGLFTRPRSNWAGSLGYCIEAPAETGLIHHSGTNGVGHADPMAVAGVGVPDAVGLPALGGGGTGRGGYATASGKVGRKQGNARAGLVLVVIVYIAVPAGQFAGDVGVHPYHVVAARMRAGEGVPVVPRVDLRGIGFLPATRGIAPHRALVRQGEVIQHGLAISRRRRAGDELPQVGLLTRGEDGPGGG